MNNLVFVVEQTVPVAPATTATRFRHVVESMALLPNRLLQLPVTPNTTPSQFKKMLANLERNVYLLRDRLVDVNGYKGFASSYNTA